MNMSQSRVSDLAKFHAGTRNLRALLSVGLVTVMVAMFTHLAPATAAEHDSELSVSGRNMIRTAIVAVDSWKVTVASHVVQAEVLATFELLQNAGYTPMLEKIVRGQQMFYVVSLANLATENDAVALALRLKLSLGIQNVSLSH